jgi:predicted nuclease of predicted toxin-antitoxin system
MRFLVDECTGPAVALWLRSQGHDVASVYEEARGMDDDVVIHTAFSQNRILITNDKDFGTKIYREGYAHRGVILLRLGDERPASKIAALADLLQNHLDRIPGRFVTVTETRVRFAVRNI